MNLINLVTNSKLQVEYKDIEKNENIIVANYIINKKIISKYIIVHADEELIRNISCNDKELRNIEEIYLETTFFNIEGDLSWNLYLVFVLESKEYEKLELKHKYIVEKSERYARKIIVSEHDFNKYIPVGQIINNNNSEIFIDPIDEWNRELEKYNLQFCLQPYNKGVAENYLIGKVDIIDQLNEPVEVDESIVNNNNILIDYLQIGRGFREHCFTPSTKLNFGTVNLLSGSNGCGKTSILEAIELTITGEIKRSSQNKYKSEIYESDKSSECELGFKDGQIIKAPKNAREMKKRESYYYQNKEKRISKLNRAFHQYNYYSYEDTFTFCYLNEQPDYNDEFSKIIFGEGSKTIERNFNRFKQEFEIQLKNINKEIESLKNQQEVINEIAVSIDMSFNLNPINILMDKIGINYEKISSTGEYEDIKNWLKNQNIILKNLRIELNNIVRRINANSRNEIQKMYKTKLEEKKKLGDKLDSLKKIIEILNGDIHDSGKTLTGLENIKKTLDDFYSNLIKEKEMFNKYTFIYNNLEKANEVLELREKINTKNVILKRLEYINDKWKEIGERGRIKSFDLKEIEAKISRIQENIEEKSFELQKLNIDIKVQETKKTTVTKIITQIKVLGDQYIQEKPESKTCPLCGKEYNSTEEFIKELKNDMFFDDSKYKKYLEKRDNVIRQINIYQKELDDLTIQKKYLDELKKANSYISKSFIREYNLNIELMNYNEMYENLLTVFDTLTIERINIKNLEDKILNLQLEGIDYDSIYKALQFVNNKLKISTNSIEENSIEEIEKYYKEQFKSIENKLLGINKQIIEETGKIDINNNEINIQSKNKSNIESIFNEMSKDVANIETILQEIDKIESTGILIRWDVSYDKLIVYIDDILKEIEDSIMAIEKNINYISRLKQMNELKKQITEKNNIMKKCIIAIEKLNNLKSLDKYCDDFIRNNIDDISKLFTSLHSPREFDKLSLDEDGKIVGYRIKKNDNNQLPIPIFMMSTGQRSAVVLSIFIRLHIIMKSAPNFILLDEPVANIDDLNILALLDFLKEICSSNSTQIFFTTANEGVSKLFKRKFSFLEDKFCEFEFIRYGNENTIINKKIYNSDNDVIINSIN